MDPPPPPEMSDAERIRARRLAKLGGNSSSSERPSPSSTTSPKPSSPAPPPSQPSQPPLHQAESKPAQPQSVPSPKISAKPAAPSSGGIRIHSGAGDIEPSSKRNKAGGAVSIETWEHRTLCSVFRITLDEEQKTDTTGARLNYLPGVRSDLEAESAELRINKNNLDQALVEAGSNAAEAKCFPYLLACWKRVMRQLRGPAKRDDPTGEKMAVLQEAKRICMSYCIFAVTMPEMFGEEPPAGNPITDALLRDSDSDAGICPDFLKEATERFAEDDGIKEALVQAVEQLSRDASKKTMNDSFKPHVQALRNCVRYVPLVEALTQSPAFLLDGIPAEQIEHHTLLGPFFALSPLHANVAANYFMGAQARDESFIRQSQNALQMTLRAHQEELLDITNCIIKSAKGPRERMLDWFAMIVNKNHKRRAMNVDERKVSGDGFMVNVTAILDRLCEPFMDVSYTKVDKIDPAYLRRSPRVLIEDETKINADQKASDEFYAQPAEGTNNFISEVFFLTVAAHHYGTEAANTKLAEIKRRMKHLERQLKEFEEERPKFAHSPQQLAMYESAMKKYKDRLDNDKCRVHAINGVLLDDVTQQRSMQLMRYVMVWLLRLVAPGSEYPKGQVALPLPEKQPDVFSCLPEYFIEDIVDNFKFVTGNLPWIITSTQCDELLTMCITFLRSSDYIKNPGLKSGLVQILYYGVLPFARKPKGILGDLLNSSKFALQNLFHALMQIYIECEMSGTHTQFYDKFNVRYEIFQVIRCIWTNPVYRENLEIESRVNHAFFVQFVNLTLNDVTFLLDESFGAFKQIHALQEELEGPAAALLDETKKQEMQELLEDNQKKAKSWMTLTNETISMLKLFTEALADAFTSQEIVQRLADMLDYNLESLVGPKQKDLKVRDPQQYKFTPLLLLSDIMSVYLNLKDKPAFHLAVARDGRSYKYETLKHATEIMVKSGAGQKSPEELKQFLKLADDIETTKLSEEAEEDWLGEIPDEFLDPLLATLMEDPVILPISRTVIDRGTIRQHLLSDPHDPFNRTALKLEDVIPDTDTKAKIEAFRAEARGRAMAAIQAKKETDAADAMEVETAAAPGESSVVETNASTESRDVVMDEA
ncbi:ubiquitin conjugation factor E4 [Venturia nashicola]|uniref:Ubiquitin conjugation factor E4 n=1 Tax=Venturia nashicola TaxID=86259 RepID=A0A4Z1NIX8_9PEZI|nr:ubiquitin conjugation factor E4 [Venturia nashicola]